jgi:hypothetical protein
MGTTVQNRDRRTVATIHSLVSMQQRAASRANAVGAGEQVRVESGGVYIYISVTEGHSNVENCLRKQPADPGETPLMWASVSLPAAVLPPLPPSNVQP